MEVLIIILIYLIGVFVSIALTAYLWRNENIEDGEFVAFFSILSWLYAATILLVLIMAILWEYVIKYPFVWFYNKCNEKFNKTKYVNMDYDMKRD